MNYRKIPIPTVKRFPSYLRILNQEAEKGVKHISATTLATELGLKPIQVRKDISSTGIEGKPKIGFDIGDLIDSLNNALGWDSANRAVIIGAGNLGCALANYGGFEAYGLSIAGIFDNDSSKIGKSAGPFTIGSMEEADAFIRENKIIVAVITVPAACAQSVADKLVDLGIRGIWNFAPKELRVPEYVALQRTDLATSLAVLSVKLSRRLHSEDDAPLV